jgi:hypothetical protein
MDAKFFVATLVAQRREDDSVIAVANPHLLFDENELDARKAAEQLLVTLFPIDDGWAHGELNIKEIPPVIESDGYRFTWQIEKTT